MDENDGVRQDATTTIIIIIVIKPFKNMCLDNHCNRYNRKRSRAQMYWPFTLDVAPVLTKIDGGFEKNGRALWIVIKVPPIWTIIQWI